MPYRKAGRGGGKFGLIRIALAGGLIVHLFVCGLCMRHLYLMLGLAGLVAGCTSAQMSSAIVKPAKYSIYNCDQMIATGRAEASRERELKALIDKAAQGPGGELAIALAYRGEYLTVQGNLRELEAAAVEKNCKMSWRTISERAVQ